MAEQKPPTTGERIMFGDEVCNDPKRLKLHRSAAAILQSTTTARIATIDAAIAAAIRARGNQ